MSTIGTMESMTLVQKAAAADKFLEWLKKKYPLPGVIILSEYLPRKTIRKDIPAQLLTDGSCYKISISADRLVSRVVQSMSHEYKHIMQLELEHIPLSKLRDAEEIAAWTFSSSAMREYVAEVGDGWRP